VNQESVTASQLQSTQDAKVQKIMALWNELSDVKNDYSDCGAKESDADWKIQATLYAISFCVLVDVPKTPKRYGLVIKAGNAQRTFECAKEMHRILSLIQVEFRAFANTLLPDELYEWMLVTCWRYCKRT
jgi:seryl-tRNA synthetase